MREGWKKEKFEDVFDLQMGKTPSRDNPSYWDGTNTWVSISDMKDKKYISKSKEQISDIAVKDSGIKQVKKGTAIMSFKLSIGKTAIAEEDLFTNEAIMAFNVRDGYGITPDYIYYYLRGYKWDGANKAVMGATLNKKTIASNYFSYPSLPEQERIVAELDCLSDIIEKQKQQLKELDNLAQSIFYTTFGDPISNNFGWEAKKLSEVCPYITDGSHYSPKEDVNGTIPMLSVKDMRQSNFSYESCKMIGDEEYQKLLSNGCKPLKDDVLVAKDGSYFKYIFALKEEREQALLSSIAIVRPDKSVINPIYLVGYLSTTEIYNEVEREYLTGTAIKRVILKGLRSMRILLPPLHLQQEFASKIEAIEKQKDMIKQSIEETETLFNSRMDYYFN